MSDELERLRADLEVIERYSSYAVLENARYDIAEKIKRIENPDPWREAKDELDRWREMGESELPNSWRVLKYVDHLTAENDRLTERVAELGDDPEFTPAILKRADEIAVGETIVASGMIRTVTGINVLYDTKNYQIMCGGWGRWYEPADLIAVLHRPLVESKENAK